MDITKVCKMCKVNKPITDYYRNKHSGYYHSNCLKCVNKMRSSYITNKQYIRKLTGMAKLNENQQQYIRESFQNSIDIKDIAQVSGINKSTLSSWLKKGQII